jgi:hypothetical protein
LEYLLEHTLTIEITDIAMEIGPLVLRSWDTV